MVKNLQAFETERERERRERNESLVKEYLSQSSLIIKKELSPNRIFNYLAGRYSLSTFGVKRILTLEGVYKDAKHPVLYPEKYKELSMACI